MSLSNALISTVESILKENYPTLDDCYPTYITTLLDGIAETDAGISIVSSALAESTCTDGKLRDEVSRKIVDALLPKMKVSKEQTGILAAEAFAEETHIVCATNIATVLSSSALNSAPSSNKPKSNSSSSAKRVDKKHRALGPDEVSRFFSASGASNSSSSSSCEATGAHSVCRFYLMGSCLRADCAFSHEVGTISCRFYDTVEGCGKGASCPFLHDTSAARGGNESSNASHPAAPQDLDDDIDAVLKELLQFLRDEDADESGEGESTAPESAARVESLSSSSTVANKDESLPLSLKDATVFPSLPSTTDGSEEKSSSVSASGKLSLAGKLSVQMLAERFPILGLAVLETIFQEHRSIDSCIRVIGETYGLVPSVVSASASNSSSMKKKTHGPLSSSTTDALSARRISKSIPWVETGSTVAALYACTRAEGESLARSRNVAFEKAARAYLNGSKAQAVSLSKQGRVFQDKMLESHAAAAASIYEHRNRGSGGGGGSEISVNLADLGGSSHELVRVIDLHGLHPSEATGLANAMIERHCTMAGRGGGGDGSSGGSWVAFLAGTRHHSKKLGSGGGSVMTALKEALSAWDLTGYEHGSGGGEGSLGGAIIVNLARARE